MCSWTPSLSSSASAAGTASPPATRTELATQSASGTAVASSSALATQSAFSSATATLTGTGTARVSRTASSSRVPSDATRSASPSASPVTEPMVAGQLVFNVPIDAANPITASSFSETMLQDMAAALERFFSASLNFTNVTAGSVSITRVSVEARRRALAEAATTKVTFDYVVQAGDIPTGAAGPAATLSAALAGSLPALVAALSSVRSIVQELGGAGGVLDLQSSSVAVPPPPPCSGPGCPLKTHEVVLVAVMVPLAVLALIAATYKGALNKCAAATEKAPALALRSAGVDGAAPADASAPAPAPADAAPAVPDETAGRPAYRDV